MGVPCIMLNFAIMTLNGKTKSSVTAAKNIISLLSSDLMNSCNITRINIHADMALRKSETVFAII